MNQLNMNAAIADVIRTSSNGTLDCLALAERYTRGQYKIPEFQRTPLLWPEAQRQSFIERLWEGPEPVGSIVVYQVEDRSDGNTYILDGLQRISTIAEFSQKPGKYGVGDPDEVTRLLMGNSFPLQHRTYRNHQHAYADFIRLQQNLQLTPYERFFGKRSLLPQWAWFADMEAELHAKMDRVMSSYRLKDVTAREEKHKYMRHNLSLFVRYCLKNSQNQPWHIGGKADGKDHQQVESHLSAFLESTAPEDVEKGLSGFMGRLDADSGIIIKAWRSVNTTEGKVPTRTAIRFLHTVGVYCAVAGISAPRLEMFAIKTLGFNYGDTQFIAERDGKQIKITIGIDDLGRIRELYNAGIITDDLQVSDRKRRASEPKMLTEIGLDAGHIRPLSKFGPGPKLPEPLSLNRAKGNRY